MQFSAMLVQDWKRKLNGNATHWLLGEDNPSVRYFTLTELLEKPHIDNEVQKAKAAIMTEGLLPKIIAKQNSESLQTRLAKIRFPINVSRRCARSARDFGEAGL
jgi:hypothetical protein